MSEHRKAHSYYFVKRENNVVSAGLYKNYVFQHFIDPRNDLVNHSPDGFEFGYSGSGPAQLALAILADYTHDSKKSINLYHEFKHRFIAKMKDGDFFVITDFEIEEFLSDIEKFYKEHT